MSRPQNIAFGGEAAFVCHEVSTSEVKLRLCASFHRLFQSMSGTAHFAARGGQDANQL